VSTWIVDVDVTNADHYTASTERQTDRQTDRRTDTDTDRQPDIHM
jgi:hypothetical protein